LANPSFKKGRGLGMRYSNVAQRRVEAATKAILRSVCDIVYLRWLGFRSYDGEQNLIGETGYPVIAGVNGALVRAAFGRACRIEDSGLSIMYFDEGLSQWSVHDDLTVD